MTPRQLLIAAGIALALTVLCVFLIDEPVARMIGKPSPDVVRAASGFVSASEVVSGMTISKWALGGALIAAGLIALALRSAAASPLLFLGATHVTARLIAGVLKNVFGRLRPFEGDAWFAGGGAMPSGHAIHWWSLYAALVLFFPRLRWILLPVPVAISIARVAVNDHWVSDTIASAALAALIAWAFARIAARPLARV